jgi:hypothetical protein
MKKTYNKRDLEIIADHLIDSINPIEPMQVSPFFKTNVLARIEEINTSSKPVFTFENYFYRSAIAVIAILVIINMAMVYNSVNSNQTDLSGVDQLISQYQMFETDTYNDYNLLASEN